MSEHSNKAMIGLFKAVDTSKGVTIEGWANKAVVDRSGDIINKGAWKLDNFQKNAIILFNHDKSKPIGKAVVTEARDEGLYVKARISQSSDPEISKIRELIKEGILNAFSVGFDCMDSGPAGDGKTEIKSAELFEVSVVSLPANQDSLFTVAKSYDYDKVKDYFAKIVKVAPTPADDKPVPKKPKAPKVPADEQADSGKPDGEPVSEDDKVEPVKKSDAPEIEVQSIALPKDKFATSDDAIKWASENGWDVSQPDENDKAYIFTQRPVDEFVSTTELLLADGVVALVGMCDPKAPKEQADDAADPAEEKPEDKTKSAEDGMPTVPLPTDAPEVATSEEMVQLRQTNVLLGQVVAEIKALRDAVTALANSAPPKAAGNPVAVAPAEQVPQSAPAQPAKEQSPDHTLDLDTALVRQYLADVKNSLDRIGA